MEGGEGDGGIVKGSAKDRHRVTGVGKATHGSKDQQGRDTARE